MEITAEIRNFIRQPFPLWEKPLTSLLVKNKWEELKKKGIVGPEEYSTDRSWFSDGSLEQSKAVSVIEENVGALYIEEVSSSLKSFYEEHGLEMLSANELDTNNAFGKVKNAIQVLKCIPSAHDCVVSLVKRIQILKQHDSEVDLGYSHPNIPFSIFVSVCADDSTISNLRVAESILHEAMHLKLTLIENIVPLVKSNSDNVFYSPWRDEERPVQGVLHGLFVFSAIAEFYKGLYEIRKLSETKDYVANRIRRIKNEIEQLKDFAASLGLNEAGASLVINLLPLN